MVRPTTLIASSDSHCCVQSAQSSLNVMEFEMPDPKPRPRYMARSYTGLGIRGCRGFSFAAAIFVLWAVTLPAQQASYESTWNPEWDQAEPGSSSSYDSSVSSSNSYGGSRSTSNTYGSSSSSNSYGGSHSTSNTHSGSSNTYGSSSNSYRSSSNSYGSSSNSYGKSSDSYGSSNSSIHTTYRADSDKDSERCRSYNDSPKICRSWQLRRPIYLAGRVALASGEGLYEPAKIAISCGGQAIPQVYTDARGRFNFQPECRPLLALADASIRSFSPYSARLTTATGTANLAGCYLYAELPGHWSTRVRLGLVSATARNEVGLIVLSPFDNSPGRSVSVTTLAAPPEAKKAYRNGLRALRKRQADFRKAAELFERAVKIHPEHAQAWSALGEARAALEQADEANEAFARSIQSDPNLLQPYDAMIRIAARNRDWKHLDSLTAEYLKLAPGSSRVRFYSAVAAWELGDLPRTESTIKQMGKLGEMDEWPMSYVLMALAHERRADFETAADYYEKYIEISVDAEMSSLARRAIYDWGHLQVIEPRPVTLAQAAAPE